MTQDDEITTDQARAHFLAKIVARDLQAAAEREADLQVRILELEQLVVQERIAHKEEVDALKATVSEFEAERHVATVDPAGPDVERPTRFDAIDAD